MKVNYEERFYHALRRITAYMTTAQLRRESERSYGLDYAEALEMAYENVRGEAQAALKGYRPKKAKPTASSPAPPETLCGGPMASRANRSSGQRFWGCKKFPDCKGTRNTDGEAAGTRPASAPAADRQDDLPSDRTRENDRGRWRDR